jgi:hypothetical protein
VCCGGNSHHVFFNRCLIQLRCPVLCGRQLRRKHHREQLERVQDRELRERGSLWKLRRYRHADGLPLHCVVGERIDHPEHLGGVQRFRESKHLDGPEHGVVGDGHRLERLDGSIDLQSRDDRHEGIFRGGQQLSPNHHINQQIQHGVRRGLNGKQP